MAAKEDLDRMYEMLTRITQSQTELKKEMSQNQVALKEELQSTKVDLQKHLESDKKDLENKLDNNMLDIRNQLESTKVDISAKVEDVKLDLTIKINDTNFKLEQSVVRINEQLKIVTEAISTVNLRCSAVESKIDEKCKVLDQTLKRAFLEQMTSMENKIKQNFVKYELEINAVQSDTERLDSAITQTKQSVERLETVVNQNADVCKTDVHNLRDDLNRVKRNIATNEPHTVRCQGHKDERDMITFKGNQYENPMEFIRSCEHEIARLSYELNDGDKLEYVRHRLRNSAKQWFNIVRDKIQTYKEFKIALENRFWNSHIQAQLRSFLEFGCFDLKTDGTPEQYVIKQMEHAIHLTPKMSEEEIIGKLAKHFSPKIRNAAFTQNTKTMDDLLLLLAKSKHIVEAPVQKQIVKYDSRQERPQENRKFTKTYEQSHETNWKTYGKPWKNQDSNKPDFPKKFDKKPYTRYNTSNENTNRQVQSMTLDNTDTVQSTSKSGTTTKKQYIDPIKNSVPSTSFQ